MKINEKPINITRYVDNTDSIARAVEDLQAMLNKIVAVSEENGLTFIVEKTTFMIISKK